MRAWLDTYGCCQHVSCICIAGPCVVLKLNAWALHLAGCASPSATFKRHTWHDYHCLGFSFVSWERSTDGRHAGDRMSFPTHITATRRSFLRIHWRWQGRSMPCTRAEGSSSAKKLLWMGFTARRVDGMSLNTQEMQSAERIVHLMSLLKISWRSRKGNAQCQGRTLLHLLCRRGLILSLSLP